MMLKITEKYHANLYALKIKIPSSVTTAYTSNVTDITRNEIKKMKCWKVLEDGIVTDLLWDDVEEFHK